MRPITFNIFFYLVLIGTALNAQSNLTLDVNKSSLIIEGTSTLHDWHIVARQLQGSSSLNKDATKITEINSLTFSVIVKGLDSGKSLMDNNTYKAMVEPKYPTVDFNLKRVESIKPSVDGKGYIIRASGDLTIVGKTINEEMKVYSLVNSDGSVQFKGELAFPMSKYSVDPPTAVMGTIKTGDDVKIKFSVVYN